MLTQLKSNISNDVIAGSREKCTLLVTLLGVSLHTKQHKPQNCFFFVPDNLTESDGSSSGKYKYSSHHHVRLKHDCLNSSTFTRRLIVLYQTENTETSTEESSEEEEEHEEEDEEDLGERDGSYDSIVSHSLEGKMKKHF